MAVPVISIIRLPVNGRIMLIAFKPNYEQALVCLSNRETVDASRGRTFQGEPVEGDVRTWLFREWACLADQKLREVGP